MIKAVIDIGTNSTRLAVANLQGGEISLLSSDIAVTRIGEQLGQERIIKPEPLARTAHVVGQYVQRAKAMGAEAISLTATSALRDARNQQEVIAYFLETTGLDLVVLSGKEEAELSYRGACLDFSGHANVSLAVLDIGGGSTELVYQGAEGLHSASVNVGAVRLYEQPKLMGQMAELLQGLKPERMGKQFELIAVGGTATSLAAMIQELPIYQPDLVHGFVIAKETVDAWAEKLADLSLTERQNLKGLMPKRADIIGFGVCILQQVMVLLNATQVKISDKDLLYGLLMEG